MMEGAAVYGQLATKVLLLKSRFLIMDPLQMAPLVTIPDNGIMKAMFSDAGFVLKF